MLLSRRRSQVAASLAIIAMFGGVSLSLGSRVEAPSIPDRIGDDVFWRMVSDYSEPGGFFRSDNFVSNEITFQWVLPELAKTTRGGVYLGVGPDQNFTYIVAMQPKVAFIVDIRRQNMLHHLLYKALIELSPDRAEFLSRLFSRPRPGGLDANAGPAALFQAYANVPADSTLYARNLAQLRPHDPVLHRAQRSRVVRPPVRLTSVVIRRHGVHEDFPESRGDRPHLRLETFRQQALRLLQALRDQIAREISIGAVLEDHRDLRQPIAR